MRPDDNLAAQMFGGRRGSAVLAANSDARSHYRLANVSVGK
jgi:hypothetical protein